MVYCFESLVIFFQARLESFEFPAYHTNSDGYNTGFDLKLLYKLADLIAKNFAGNLNILLENNNQFIASIGFADKRIVTCRHGQWTGSTALFEVLIRVEKEYSNLTFVEEAEIINKSSFEMEKKIQDLEAMLGQYYQLAKFAPPDHIKLMIDGDFIVSGETISSQEFDLLGTISDYSRVNEIYVKSSFSPTETLVHLVSLRRKKALRVLGRRKP